MAKYVMFDESHEWVGVYDSEADLKRNVEEIYEDQSWEGNEQIYVLGAKVTASVATEVKLEVSK